MSTDLDDFKLDLDRAGPVFAASNVDREMKNPGGIARRGLQSEVCSQTSVPTS